MTNDAGTRAPLRTMIAMLIHAGFGREETVRQRALAMCPLDLRGRRPRGMIAGALENRRNQCDHDCSFACFF